jgi:cytoskeletal protein CcmA (bactofilin family)
LKIHGIGSMRGGLAGDHIELHGSLSIGGDCEAERIQANGKFAIDGLLNAGTIAIKLFHGSHVKEIGGEHIDVRKGHRSMWNQLLSAIIPSAAPNLVTDLIEGDDIYLEHTEAAVVRGNTVKIGPGCRIDRVEYKQSFDRHSRSTVKSHLKV